MASIGTAGLTLPNHLAAGVWTKGQKGSAIAALSGAEPQKFGVTQYMTLTAPPKAEVVGEGSQKGYSNPTFAPVTSVVRKTQVTMRFNEEVQWADEDDQLEVLSTCADAASIALSRALDLVGIHGINPLTGAALAGNPVKLMDTTNVVEVTTTSKPDADLEAGVALILADGITPTGIALDGGFSFALATMRDGQGRKIYPDLGFGQNLTDFNGLSAAVSDTVSAPEAAIAGGAYAATNPHVKAITGNWSAFRWGVQRQIPIETILYGDPDGQGDLKRNNQIALRLELVFGVGILSLDAFAKTIDAAA